MEKSDQDQAQHNEQEKQSSKDTTGLHEVKTSETSRSRGDTKYESHDPPSHKSRCKTWWKRNTFNALLTLFTAIYSVSFIYGTYVNERAYVSFGRADGTLAELVPGAGIRVFYANHGRTPARDFTIQVWMSEERQIIDVSKWLSPTNHRVLPANSVRPELIIWPASFGNLTDIVSQRISVGIAGRITYTDAFLHRPHCTGFVAIYEPAPVGEFIDGGTSGICDSNVKALRYNSVCVPTADKKSGAWITTWEGFNITSPGSQSPTSDPAPCLKTKQ